MSAADYLLTEEQLLCCICLDVFSDPVTVPCGHNFCKKCITQHLNSNSRRLCPMCNERVDRKCKFGVNTFISEMTLQFRQSTGRNDGKRSEQQVAEPREVSSDVPTGTNLLPSCWTFLKFCLFLVFGLLCLTVTLKLFDAVENAEGSVCPKHGKPLEVDCKNEQMPTCQSCVDSSHRFHDVVPLKEEYEAKIKELQETKAVTEQKIQELLRLLQNTVDVTLDPETVHPHLIVSDDGKQVHQSGVWNEVPDNLKQLDRVECILGQQSFSLGRFYYDVQVKGKTAWILGVTKESVNRKGDVRRNPENGMWALMHINGDYLPLTSQNERLSVKDRPEKVRVFVDPEEGLVAFQNADSAALIYSFTGCSFTERIYPIFCPIDSVPLILNPAVS